MRNSRSLTVLSKVLIIFGTFALTLGAFAGIVNNNLLNGPKLAEHIESIRQDPAVIAKMSVQLADVVIEKRCKACGVWDAGVHAVGGCLGGGTLSVACE